jgi:hypothetical protein
VIFDVLSGLVPIVIDAATNSWTQTQGSHCTGNLEELPMGNRFAHARPEPRPHLEDVPEMPTQPIRSPALAVARPNPGTTGYMEVPPGARYVADIQKQLYYVIACVDRPDLIPLANRYYYRTEAAAQADGYLRAPDCWEGGQ